MQKVIILSDIRSALNVGSIFRTADALGISKLFLTGYTPTPTDRFGRAQKDIAKTALGAENSVLWEKREDVLNLIKELKKDGTEIIAIEQDSHAIDYKEVKVKKKVAFVFGNEVDGLSKEILNECDFIAEIPMKGEKESLNVSVALGVALFRILEV